MLFRFILLVLAGIYYIAYKLHHRFCLRPGRPLGHAQLIVVGSFRIGGAGKTPFAAWITELVCTQTGPTGTQAPRVAILCHKKAADEAEMLRLRFAGMPQVQVFTTGNRYHTAHEIDGDFDYIVCDDGFEDSRLAGAKTIRLDWGTSPEGIASLFPAGQSRSLPADHAEPSLVLNCASATGESYSGTIPDIVFEIGSIANCNNAAPQESPTPLILCGIADRGRFAGDIEAFGIRAQCGPARPDHDPRFRQTLSALLEKGEQVIITEKDFARLGPECRQHPGLFVARQKITLSKSAENAVKALCDLRD